MIEIQIHIRFVAVIIETAILMRCLANVGYDENSKYYDLLDVPAPWCFFHAWAGVLKAKSSALFTFLLKYGNNPIKWLPNR